MHQGKLVFAQLMHYLPLSTFRRCVADHRGEHKVKDFSCLDQFFAMAFAQLTYRESLRDIEVNLRAQARRLYHMGFRCQTISRNTLANANATRPWQIYADFAQHLIGIGTTAVCQECLTPASVNTVCRSVVIRCPALRSCITCAVSPPAAQVKVGGASSPDSARARAAA